MRVSVIGAGIALASAGFCLGGTFSPNSDGGPFCLSAAFGAAACSVTTQYDSSGVVFSNNGVGTATFDDGVNAWGGINGSGTVDLVTAVNGQIVVPGTTQQGVTDTLDVEAGFFSAAGNGELLVFGAGGVLLASRFNGLDGTGPDGRDMIDISVPGIESFSVITPNGDTFGVDQITVGTIGSVNANAPEPSAILLFGTAAAGVFFTLRKKLA